MVCDLAFQWTVEPAAISFDLFDPRYRQWFIGAEASPKDVLFLIDFSGSVKGQTQHLTKMTILHVLATLGPNDYFNAVWYSSRQELVFDYCFSGFLPATTRNKRLFQNQLERIEERDQAHLAPALNYSLSLFRQRAINASEFLQDTMGMGSGGHQIIMIFTDGIEEWPIALVEQEMDSQGEDIVRIFGFSMGYGTGELPILDYVSCNTRASYSIVDSIADVKLQSRSYLTTLAEVLALSYRDKGTAQKRPVSWSLPYMDTQGKGPVVTLSMPILNTMLNSTNLFLGVAGVDILFTELVKMLPNDEQIRTFVLDNNGIVVYHPKLMTPRREVYSVRRTACYDTSMPPRRGGRVQFGGSDERVLKLMGLVDSIQTTDILELEDPTEAFKKFREAMIDRACGRVFHDGDLEYRCHALENTPLVIGFVGRRSGTVLSLKYTSKKPQVAMKDLVGFYVPKRQLCGDRFDGVNDLERLAAYVNDEEDDQCTDDRKIPYAFTNILSSWSRSWPDLDENATCSTARLPDAGFSHHHLSSFVHTFSKISAFYPQCFFDYVKPILTEISSRNKPSDEEHGESLKTSVIEDSFVATKEIRDSKYGKLLATVGVQWKMQFFSELWINQTHWEVGWEECFKKQRDCHIITSTGYVVASSTSRLGSLAQVDFQLFDTLVDRGFLKPISRVDHQKYCKPEAGNSYSMSTSDAPSSSGPARSFVKALISTFHSVFWFIMGFCIPPLQAQPIMVGSICKFSRIKHLEQCSMEYVHYSLKTLKKSAMTIRHENCSRVATIMPFEKINLNLVIMDGLCDENETFKEADPFVPKRVPDCQLTTPFYRKPRLDVDYSRYHPDEFRRDCPALAAGVVYSGVLLLSSGP
ncbi:hypothetical protein L596_002884 [Steinernema carpocapsae]|uniref:VWFA domain-containing protein n=1 Tax=Steinernema carpocapsae TaxID=34508 RepID=A0A4U8UQZ6_STECR|nr:hypothetical protein L596_002884 [Steinernema carpocapsae]